MSRQACWLAGLAAAAFTSAAPVATADDPAAATNDVAAPAPAAAAIADAGAAGAASADEASSPAAQDGERWTLARFVHEVLEPRDAGLYQVLDNDDRVVGYRICEEHVEFGSRIPKRRCFTVDDYIDRLVADRQSRQGFDDSWNQWLDLNESLRGYALFPSDR